MKIEDYHLGFVGFGRTGQMIARGLDASKLIGRSHMRFYRRDPAKAKQNEKDFGISSTTLETLVDSSQILLICTPSNQADFVLQDLSKLRAGSKMIVSLMGQIKLAFLQKHLGSQSLIARALPNIAVSVREGMTLLSFTPHPSLEFRSVANLLFSALGQAMEIPESQIDIANSLSETGAAIAFELIDAMAKLGEKEGIAYAKGLKLAAQTFSGAGHLILKGALPPDLVSQMTIHPGAVAAGVQALHKREVLPRLQEALRASFDQSRKLSEEYF